MSDKVWLVWYDNGQGYDDHYESVVGVFSSPEKAQEYIKRMETTPGAIPCPGYLSTDKREIDKPQEDL